MRKRPVRTPMRKRAVCWSMRFMARAVVLAGGRGEVHAEDHDEDVVDREDYADDDDEDVDSIRIDHSH